MPTDSDRNKAMRRISVLAWLTERANDPDRIYDYASRLTTAMMEAHELWVTREQIDTAVIYGLELAGLQLT